MAAWMEFRWSPDAAHAHFDRASARALARARSDADMYWDATVPVVSGTLRDSWFSWIAKVDQIWWLVFGATAAHAIYVELGTSKMEPRAPVRGVAGEITPLVWIYFWQELQRRG